MKQIKNTAIAMSATVEQAILLKRLYVLMSYFNNTNTTYSNTTFLRAATTLFIETEIKKAKKDKRGNARIKLLENGLKKWKKSNGEYE